MGCAGASFSPHAWDLEAITGRTAPPATTFGPRPGAGAGACVPEAARTAGPSEPHLHSGAGHESTRAAGLRSTDATSRSGVRSPQAARGRPIAGSVGPSRDLTHAPDRGVRPLLSARLRPSCGEHGPTEAGGKVTNPRGFLFTAATRMRTRRTEPRDRPAVSARAFVCPARPGSGGAGLRSRPNQTTKAGPGRARRGVSRTPAPTRPRTVSEPNADERPCSERYGLRRPPGRSYRYARTVRRTRQRPAVGSLGRPSPAGRPLHASAPFPLFHPGPRHASAHGLRAPGKPRPATPLPAQQGEGPAPGPSQRTRQAAAPALSRHRRAAPSELPVCLHPHRSAISPLTT